MSSIEHSNHNHSDEIEKLKDEDLIVLETEESKAFLNKIKNNRKKASKALKTFTKNLGNEAIETKEASKVVYKFMKGEKITKEEELELRTQIYDIFKMVGIGIPFMLIPGSTLLMPFIIKVANKYGINLLPTSFTEEEE
ncbi:MAG: phenylalanyl-tRNA synthetase alpha subunit [Flavobacteriales bacterium]|jgi:hypothetical protein